MDPEPSTYLIIFFTLLGSAFFSGMEIAFVSANRLMIELDRQKGTWNGRILSYFVKNEPHFISTMLLGNNVFLVVYGIFMAVLLEPFLNSIGDYPALILLLQTIISTLIVLITAEFLPKAIFRINPNRTLKVGTIPLLIIYIIFFIPTTITMWISSLFLRLVRADTEDKAEAFTKVDLDHYVRDLSDRIEEEAHMENEIQILQNALEFPEVKARDCMVPRTEIVALEIEDSIDTLRERFIESGLSKILIYRDSIDNIIGYVHSYELFNRPHSIKQILLPISIVPEAVLVKNLLEQFTRLKRTIAVVVDEFGGTSGLVTIEDIIEEIFGEIQDEHDHEDILEEKIDEHTFLFSGRTEIDYVRENYELPIPESTEYETIAGFVLNKLEDIPDQNETFEWEELIFTVMEVSDSKIELIKIKIKE
ncbi:MAG: hemolysin family protein [Flavobacteriales bacterium]|nr:hemolysin family protein [Flavobacteriales bacterium]